MNTNTFVVLPANKTTVLPVGIVKAIKSYNDGSENGIVKGNYYFNKNTEITSEVKSVFNSFEPQHLYEVSNDEIKEGDFYFDKVLELPLQAKGHAILFSIDPARYNKIVASTNESLGVPLISNDVIQQFVKHYSQFITF